MEFTGTLDLDFLQQHITIHEYPDKEVYLFDDEPLFELTKPKFHVDSETNHTIRSYYEC